MIAGPGPAHRSRPGRGEIYALVFAALFPTFGAWLYFVRLAEGPLFQIAYVGCKAIQFGLPVAWLLLTRVGLVGGGSADLKGGGNPGDVGERTGRGAPEGRSEPPREIASRGPLEKLSEPGLRSHRLMAGLITGALIAGVIFAGYLLLLRGGPAASAAAERVAERLAAMGAATPLRYALLAVFISILHSWLEEYYWRWFLFGRIRVVATFRTAAALSSLAFASHHVVVLWTYLGTGPSAWLIAPLAISVVLGGLIWAWLYERSGSILPGWIRHVIADLTIMAMGWDLALAAR